MLDVGAAVIEDVAFICEKEQLIASSFLEKGYIISQAENNNYFATIQRYIAEAAALFLKVKLTQQPKCFLDDIHKLIDPKNLNELRVFVINKLINTSWFRPALYHLSKAALHSIVGNELAMQRGVGLSVQLPGDDSSLLGAHADSWTGDSPFEVVLWLPLTDCFNTKAMYILPPKHAENFTRNFDRLSSLSDGELFSEIEPNVTFISIKAGQCLLFNQNLPHGNIINRESETRWSLNCRFKGLFSPYADKKLGEFFQPITMKAATKIGIEFEPPLGEVL